METGWFDAANNGDIDRVKYLIKKSRDLNECGTALQAAAGRGHKEIVEILIKVGVDANALAGDTYNGNALQAAAKGGYKEIVKLLIRKGAEVNAQSGEYGNALHAAANSGHKEVVKILIEAGGDVNAQGGYYGNALQAAAKYGHKEVVEILVKAGADVNAQCGHYGNALQAAANSRQIVVQVGVDVNAQGGDSGNALQAKDVVEILLTAGADVNAQGGLYGNALQAAAICGHREVVEILMKAGADVNVQGGQYGNALQAAAVRGYKEVVEILMNAGADVNAQGGHLGNALQTAAKNGHREIVEILMKAGADVDAQGGYYGIALQAAALWGHKEIMKILITAGACINALGGRYGSALQAATVGGYKESVEILITAGADVKAQGGEYGNALQAAALRGNKELVEILIKAGADLKSQGGKYGNALQAAAKNGHKEVVEILIKAGQDVDGQGGVYGNALQAAALRGDEELVEILMKAGADVNAQGGKYGNALQAAAKYGHREIVEILIKAGEDVNAQGGEYGNTLQAAVSAGQEHIVTLMLQNSASSETESKAKDNRSILHAAVASKNSGILTMLLGSGAGKFLNARDTSGQTPIHIAAAIYASELQTLKMLQLLKDSDPNIQDIDGRTPLHLAVNAQKTSVVKYLLDLGAIADTPDFGDNTPFELAAQSKNLGILFLLFPKIQNPIMPINASRWRSIIPRAGEERIIKMTGGEHANVEIMDRVQFSLYLSDRSYSFSAMEVVATEKSLGTYTMERQILLVVDFIVPSWTALTLKSSILLDEKELGNFFSSGVQCRWWRRTLKDKTDFLEGNLKESRWTAQMNTVPSAVTISQVRSGECFLECRLALPVLTPNQLHESPEWIKPFRQLKKNYSIIWIMVKPKSAMASSGSRETLVSRTFFSTLEYAAVPNYATDLFVPLVQQLHGEWNDLYTAAEEHQSDMRTRVLVSNGRDAILIRVLLLDARLWGWLRKLSEGQALTLRTLQKNYKTRGWTVLHEEGKDITEEKLQSFEQEIKNLTDQMDLKLKGLEAASQELIQLEFNLTSIAEAQKSTSTNVSMKRLSWITFIFLPLMFISSLFGMNVDILKSNPDWWIYIIFAVGTMILTLGVWILSKRYNLEGQIEERFQWLVKRKNVDEEKGIETTLKVGTRWTGKVKAS